MQNAKDCMIWWQSEWPPLTHIAAALIALKSSIPCFACVMAWHPNHWHLDASPVGRDIPLGKKMGKVGSSSSSSSSSSSEVEWKVMNAEKQLKPAALRQHRVGPWWSGQYLHTNGPTLEKRGRIAKNWPSKSSKASQNSCPKQLLRVVQFFLRMALAIGASQQKSSLNLQLRSHLWNRIWLKEPDKENRRIWKGVKTPPMCTSSSSLRKYESMIKPLQFGASYFRQPRLGWDSSKLM